MTKTIELIINHFHVNELSDNYFNCRDEIEVDYDHDTKLYNVQLFNHGEPIVLASFLDENEAWIYHGSILNRAFHDHMKS